jgi:hypothetical protein
MTAATGTRWMAVTKVTVAAALVALAACAVPDDVAAPTQTTPPPTTTTQVPPPTTAPATTSTAPTADSTVPLVEGIPPEALALIGAPMPEVDLSFDDGFDGEVWFAAYVEWNRWAFANPEGGLETLAEWVVPDSEQYEALFEQLQASRDNGWRTVRTAEVFLHELEAADEFVTQGLIVLSVLTSVAGEVWILDEGWAVVASEDFGESSPVRSAVEVRLEGGEWKLGRWQ